MYNRATEVSYAQARSSFADLLERAVQGERITITQNGKPVAELGPTGMRARLDLARLKAVRAEVSSEKIENGVLLAREQAFYSS